MFAPDSDMTVFAPGNLVSVVVGVAKFVMS